MSIASYSDLLTAMTSWGVRSDQAALYPDFIALFEAEANRQLRVRQMQTSATITMTSGSGSLPADYLAWRQVVWPGSVRVILEYADRAYLEEMYPTQPADVPRYFTIEGETISVMPVDNTSLSMRYFQKIPALSVAATSNWLLAAHPDAYLWGSLGELFSKVRDIEKASLCFQRRDAVFNSITDLSSKSKGPASIRPQNVWVA